MSARTAMTIELGRHRLRAVAGVRDGNVVRITRVLSVDVPATWLDDDSSTRGAWIREELTKANIEGDRAFVALGRDEIMLKRLTLPTRVADELPHMVRLSLGREMLVDPDDAVIDYVVIEEGETSTTVTAVAAPNAVLDRVSATLAAAGLSADRVTLRVMGVVELVRSLGRGGETCVLTIDVAPGSVEFSVVEGGVVRFSRAAELPAQDTAAAVAERLVTETRRTWMSYRIVESATELDRVLLFGEPGVVEPAAAVIGEMLGVPGEPVATHPRVDDASGRVQIAWPLAGLLLDEAAAGIDFAAPRQGAGDSAKRRRRGLMAAGLAVVLLLAGWTFARSQLKGLERKLDGLETRIAAMRPAHDRYLRDTFTLAHLNRLDEADVAWLDHLVAIKDVLPPRDRAILDAWQGTLEFRGIRYDHAKKTWSTPRVLTMIVEGEAIDRRTADSVRAALVADSTYGVTSTGADTRGGQRYPYGFRYRLTTTKATPKEEPKTPAEAGP